jgi:hypothetical protein
MGFGFGIFYIPSEHVWDPTNVGHTNVSTPHPSTIIQGDPLFNSVVANDFTLKSSSPAMNVGNSVSDYPTFSDYALSFTVNPGSKIDLAAFQAP